jgi:hypothetical protein
MAESYERAASGTFRQLTSELLAHGLGVRFQAMGQSMFPAIEDGEILHVEPVNTATLRVADIVLFKNGAGFKAHRIIRKSKNIFVTRGDSGMDADSAIMGEQIMGKIVAKENAETGRLVSLGGPIARLRFSAGKARKFASKQLRSSNIRAWKLPWFIWLLMLLVPHAAVAQGGGVALDNANSHGFNTGAAGGCTGAGPTFLCSFNHTTNSVIGTTGLLVVGVSVNTKNRIDSSVTGITYNGVALTQAANANPGNKLRVEIFYLKNPPVGTFAVVSTFNRSGSGAVQLSFEVGAVTLYRVNLGFTSLLNVNSFGINATATDSIATGTNDGVLDMLAVAGGTTVTANAGEIQQWNASTGSGPQDVEATSSSEGGTGGTVTMQENLGVATAWTIAAVDIPAVNPTSVRVNSFSAAPAADGVRLTWNTAGEMHNLGFNVYRDIDGQKVPVNPSLIAGSALLMHETLEQHGAKTYGWIDHSPAPAAAGLYWLEDVDVNGTRTMRGPVSVQAGAVPVQSMARTITMQDLAPTNSVQDPGRSGGRIRESVARLKTTSAGARSIGFELASHPAVKILVDHEGWYHITQPQLVAAGLSATADSRSLHLFAEGVEQPIRVTNAEHGFGPQAAIEFYGTAIDTPYSGQRVYWLVANHQPGERIGTEGFAPSVGTQVQSFIQTLEIKPRTTYFAALLHENTDNFFGPLVSPTSAVQTLKISNLASGQATMDVALQGITEGQQHDVTVMLNGATLGNVAFSDQQEGKVRFAIPHDALTNGTNTITFTAQQGDNDLSLVDHIDVSFPHTLTAESDFLKFTAGAGEPITVTGFLQPPTRLIDVTDPARPIEVISKTLSQNGTYALQASVPWTSPGTHALLALSDAQLASPAELVAHHPSNLHAAQSGAEYVIVAGPPFAAELKPLAALRKAEGRSVSLVSVDDIYDEFNFGERTPYAIRDFLQTATAAWKNKPHYLLLAGDASVDPRNYLGFGFFDFVPTRIVITSELKTASDDWFSDFNNTGFATIATGRLPARTSADAQIMVGKILNYANEQPGDWTNKGMLVADVDDPTVSFSTAALSVQKMLPSSLEVTDVFASVVGPGNAHNDILSGINAGQLLVNYNGHGSVQIWGSGLFDDSAAASLTNGNKLPVFFLMNCLNGFFHDVYTHSLASALMLAPNGGGVAVWASSGLTEPEPQFQMDQILVRTLFSRPSISLGDAVLFAKSGIADPNVRKTYILFGDPLMRLKRPAALPELGSAK